MHDDVVRDLERARARTLELTDLDEPTLVAQHDPLMSPLVWDLAHIGQQEELWLLRGGDPDRPGMLPPDVDSLYDAFKHRRADRPTLPLLPPVEARAYDHEVRGRVLDLLERTPDEDLFTAGMVVQHEEQHDETMLATLQLRQGPPVLLARQPLPPGRPVDGRPCVRGRRPVRARRGRGHRAVLARQRAARAHRRRRPVLDRAGRRSATGSGASSSPTAATTGRDLWSARGWEHRVEAGLERPKFWTADGTRRRFGIEEDVPPDEPVQHVCYFEAEAFASLGGRAAADRDRVGEGLRLGSRHAQPGGPGRGGRSRPPPDRANLGGTALRPAPVGAYPAGASAYGAEQMIGDVWEWTSSDFVAVAGVRADDLPRLQRAVLRRRLQGAARRLVGGGPVDDPALVPQLGSPDPAADLHRRAGLGAARWDA